MAFREQKPPGWAPTHGRLVGALLMTAVLAWGCGGVSVSPGPTPGVPATATPTSTPSHADTLRVGYPGRALGYVRGWLVGTELSGIPVLTFGNLVYSGLYRHDALDGAVPELADGPCFVPAADGRVLRCRLIETTFQDGTPLTADDVAYTYQLFQRDVMHTCCSVTGSLLEVRVVDPRTVDFVLSAVDPTFVTLVLPSIPIFPRHGIEAAVADFDARTKGLTSDELVKLADTISAEISRDPPVCSDARVTQVDALYGRLGWQIFHEDALQDNGTFDACAWLGDAAANLGWSTNEGGSVGWTLAQTGLDRMAGVVGWTAWTGRLVGTGPYRYVSQDADHVHFEAWAGHHGGLAATRYVDFLRVKSDGSDLLTGAVDVIPSAWLGLAFQATAAGHGVQVATPPTSVFAALTFNVRTGRLFADLALRHALQLCIDLPRDVDAATDGTGTTIYGPVLPGSWADDPNLPQPARDTTAAKRLIEGAGWQLGGDGIYAKGRVRLAADILVRGDAGDRRKMADLIALQARECGMDLQTLPLDYGKDIGPMLDHYPHDIPGTKTPFDLYIPGWDNGPDPDVMSIYASTGMTDAKHPAVSDDYNNFGGFSDPVLDRLLEFGKATYDQAERTRIYQQAQQELAAQLPAIFLWSQNGYDAVRSTVATVDGPLDLTAPNWAWQPERMVVVATP